MDDALQHIPESHLETVNSVRMYLHIFMLSDISNSNGKALLHNMLDNSAQPSPSTLSWPYQPPPTPAAWQIWSNAMRTLYTTSTESLNIQKPLGPWIPQQNQQTCKWSWFACPETLNMFQKHGTQWYVHTVVHMCRRYVIYSSKPNSITRHLPTTATLATPYQTPDGNDIVLNLPIHPWIPTYAATQQPDSQDTETDSD